MDPKDRLIIALDVDTAEKALALVDQLKAEAGLFKVGFELFSSCGPSIVSDIAKEGGRIFLDLKFHDIPNTVSKAAASVTGLGVFMLNVHALGGYDMMKKAAESVKAEAARLKVERPKVIAVTVLTSMDQAALDAVGVGAKIDDEVLALAALAKSAGLDGVVASPREVRAIRGRFGKDFVIVTPGVRPLWSEAGDPSTGSGSVLSLSKDDQKRIATPGDAVAGGATYIVVGRPVTEARDPAGAARKIKEEIGR
jgi:orotidine-5'-phosphate decarboxylase